MIVNCPNCEKSFVVPDAALGDKGRKVRCTSCAHVWHQRLEDSKTPKTAPQKPVDETSKVQSTPDNEVVEEPIPNAIKPEIDIIDADGDTDTQIKASKMSVMKGIAAGIVVFAIASMFFVTLRGSLAASIPGLIPLYNSLGFELNLPGQDLVFDKITVDILPLPEAEGDDSYVYQVTGNIINLGLTPSTIPSIQAQFYNSDDVIGDQQYVYITQKSIAGEDSVSFSSVLSVPEGLETQPNELRLSFILSGSHAKKKSVSETKVDTKKDHHEGEDHHEEKDTHDDGHHEEPSHDNDHH